MTRSTNGAAPTVGHLPLARLSRGSLVSRRVLASAVALTAATLPNAVLGQTAPIVLPPVSVEQAAPVPGAPAASEGYKIDKSASDKFTAPILDTPKSISIIPKEVIEEQGAKSLVDVLRTQPGISLGAPESGNPLGDRFYIRGFDARNDIFIDGMRNAGSTTRETFNVEQIEIVKGPGSAYVGRGSTGGAVNIVTKQARLGEFSQGVVTLGTDMTRRFTVDTNQMVGTTTAFRVNGLWQSADVAGRDSVYTDNWGIAPSLSLGIGKPTRINMSYYHLSQKNMPDYGVPLDERTGRPATVPRSNFYGFGNRDFRKVEADNGTLDIQHDFNDNVTLRNVTRFALDGQDYIASGPNARNWNTNLLTMQNLSRNTKTKSFLNQTDVTTNFDTGPFGHVLNAGVEYSNETSRNRGYAFEPTTGQTQNIYNPITSWVGTYGPSNAWFKLDTTTTALYVFDTMKLNEQWELNGGLRFDMYNSQSYNVSATNVPTKLGKGSEFLNYQAGIVYKPVPIGSIYLAYATSSNPSGEVIDATASDYGGLVTTNAAMEPETSETYEIGTKWDLRNKRLQLTSSYFVTNKNNMRVAAPGGGLTQTGEVEVEGFELGATGYVARGWSVFAGFTHLIPIVKNAGPTNLANNGKQMANVSRDAFSLWTNYELTKQFSFGGGAYYQSYRYGTDANQFAIPSYWRFDLQAGYKYSDNVAFRANVQNLTDKIYFDSIYRSATSYAIMAPGRSASLTATVKF